MERCIGLDAHGTSCTLAVIGPSGKKIRQDVSDSRGQKSDALDALRLAEQLRIGAIKCSVFKAPGQFSRLRELARVHSMLMGDAVRVQLRVKALYRSRGVSSTGTAVYSPKDRAAWLQELSGAAALGCA